MKAFDIPIIVSDAIPDGVMFMLPPDVTKAMETALSITNSAFAAAVACWLGPLLFDRFWLLVADDLQRIAAQKARAMEFAMAGAELTIEVAASEKRIGCIKNLAW